MGQQLTVGCKLPNGLHLDHGGKRVTLNGTNSTEIIGGHGLTMVDKEFFDAWYDAHREYPAVKQGLIFAHEKRSNAEGEAKEKVDNPSGFERLDPNKPGPGLAKDDGK
jgi:hypothetical protein